MSCIFCRIAAGEIPSHTVLEDEHVIAFLDIHPLAPGHTLVVPRVHVQLVEEIQPPALAAFAAATSRLAKAVRESTGAPATLLAIHNGREAGQEVPHCHLHIVPRQAGDGGSGIHAIFARRAKAATSGTSTDLAAIATRVRAALGG